MYKNIFAHKLLKTIDVKKKGGKIMKYEKPVIQVYDANKISQFEAAAWSCTFLSCTFTVGCTIL